MSFFNSLYNSLYNFKWLRQQKDNTRWAWGYFFLLTFLLAGLIVIPTSIKYFSDAPIWKAKLSQELPDFQAHMSNGQLQVTGVAQPYIKKYENAVIVVDTVSTSTLQVKQFVDNDSVVGILVTRDRAEIYNPQDKTVKSQVFAAGTDFDANRAMVLGWADTLLSRRMLSLFTLGFSIIILLYLVVGNLINIFFISLVLYQWGKKHTFTYTFKEVFTVGLFAITGPLILDQMVVGIPFMSLLWSVLFAVIMYYALFKKEK
ncbi:MAG: DUF1189 family protein [Candidatus Magasanikbacteria bacterium]|nr:DUF1189 family protein [Candidatus Magasanikbacteria bacterium]